MISLPGSNSWVDQVKRLDHWIKKQQEKKVQDSLHNPLPLETTKENQNDHDIDADYHSH